MYPASDPDGFAKKLGENEDLMQAVRGSMALGRLQDCTK
jgi:hypothetical protein